MNADVKQDNVEQDNINDAGSEQNPKSKGLNSVEVWKVRKKHILRWLIVAIIITIIYLSGFGGEFGIMTLISVAPIWVFYILWLLVPLTVMKAENGSMISSLARSKISCKKGKDNKPTISISDAMGRGIQNTLIAAGSYNIDNAFGDMMFGVRVSMMVLGPVFWVARILFPIVPRLITPIISVVKNVLCYLVLMIPFPITTLYWFIKSKKKNPIFYIIIVLIVWGIIKYWPMIVVSFKY